MPRYVPDAPLPPYAFVPGGRFPHPTRDPGGHRYGASIEKPPSFDAAKWRDCKAYLVGIDLFNHGYYWEAHEAWESIWHVCGRRGLAGDFLRALIHLAAAGVKVRENRPGGISRHAASAEMLFRRVAEMLRSFDSCYMGLRLRELCESAGAIAQGRAILRGLPEAPVAVVFECALQPS
jgi:predicted metal-dependent hydrolase